jgi:hypothetical protein
MIIDWPTQEERYAIAQAHRDQFKALYNQTGMVEGHALLNDFKFISGARLLELPRFPACREIAPELRRYADLDGNQYFLSHRWLSADHPDPDGKQLALLRAQIDPRAHYWVDYTSLPQKPRSPEEETLFRQSMTVLPSLMFRRHFIILRFQNDGYFGRAWCFFELLAAHVVGRELSYVYEIPEIGANAHVEEQRVLERSLAGAALPAGLKVTDPADLGAIEELTKTVATFSLLNLVSHYLGLGQLISNQRYFFGEDRYYFMATCDFTRLLLWTLRTGRELGLGLFNLSLDEFEENIFIKIAGARPFHHDTDIYALPKEVTLDAARLHWLSENRRSQDSATNLFYLLSSMITPVSAGREPPATQPLPGPDSPTAARDAGDARDKVPRPTAADEEQVARQEWGNPDRLSIELECPPRDPRPPEVFEMAIAGTGLSEDDFEDSGRTVFGRKEYLVKANPDAIARYRRARPTIEQRLLEYYKRGLVRAATW